MASETFNSIWHVNPGSGTGDTTLAISAEPNTGRNQRNIILSASGPDDLESSNKLSIAQIGKHMSGQTSGGYIDVVNPSNTVDAAGGSVSFSGSTNLQTVKFNLSNVTVTAASITVNGVTSNLSASDITALTGSSGYSPSGDPGADGSYTYSITATVGSNSGQNPRTLSGTIGYSTVVANLSVSQNGLSNSIQFTSTRGGDYSGGDVVIELNSDGTAWQDGYSRTIKIVPSPNTLTWTIEIDS